jgi:hypothetical protein
VELILASVFSAIIIFISVFSIVKVLIIAFNRKEISFGKLIVFSTSSFVIGLLVAYLLPFGYQNIVEYFY